jgi:hypothetical protein
MKTPASIWIPSLLLAMAGLSGASAQNATNLAPVAVDSAAGPIVLSLKAPPPPIQLSPWATEIVKLAQAGIEESVMLSFIDNSGTFNLGADQLVYLNDLGVPSPVVNAMLQHDRDFISGARPLTIASAPPEQPVWPTNLAASSESPRKPNLQPATTPPPAPTPAPAATKSDADSPTDLPSGVSGFQSTGPPNAIPVERNPAKRSALNKSRAPSEKERSIYRVRDPRPVEFLPPIVFVNEIERTPNTFIIELFPNAEDR